MQIEINTEENNNSLEGKYLTFALGIEHYGIAILKVQEIIGISKITPIPNSPKHVKGVINLRGKIIPVIDLRTKFNMDERAYDERTCFIVVNSRIGDNIIAVGIVVDTVVEVVHLESKQIEPAPDFGNNLKIPFIVGLGKTGATGQDVVTLVDIDQVLAGEKNLLPQ